MIELIAAILFSYLAGSFPSSIVIGKLFNIDPRKHGSGNAGATNAIRLFGLTAGIVVIILDVGKGVFSVLFISKLAVGTGIPVSLISILCGFAAVAGHIWTVFAGFKGGKGVATAAGMVFIIHPFATAGVVPFAIIILVLSGYVSLASIGVSIIFPINVFIFYKMDIISDIYIVWASFVFPLLIGFTHRNNITRLIKNEENRFEKIMFFKPKKIDSL
jgi:glycerol-3-phosphate acyltransferase PlsY